jgi:hypothetical protein
MKNWVLAPITEGDLAAAAAEAHRQKRLGASAA